MKKFGVSLLVVLLALGVMVLFSGCGDDDGGGGLPKSSSSYAGSTGDFDLAGNIEAMSELPEGLYSMFWGILEGLEDEGTSTDVSWTREGSESGTLAYSLGFDYDVTDTRDYMKVVEKISFDNYEDEGEEDPYVMVGDGNSYFLYEWEETYDGEEVVPEGVGQWLTYKEIDHANYSSYYVSYAPGEGDEFEKSGWATFEFNENEDPGDWTSTFKADAAYNNLTEEEFFLFQMDATKAYLDTEDETTLDGDGTVCVTGDAPDNGCFDFALDLNWIGGDYPWYPIDSTPDGGTVVFTAGDDTVTIDYDTIVACNFSYTINTVGPDWYPDDCELP